MSPQGVACIREKPLNRANPASNPAWTEVLMPRRLISTGSPFEKTAGYSRAVIDGDFAFVAGTTGYEYNTMIMPADITSQSRNCFKTIEATLKEGGFAMADIVRATYYITDPKDAEAHFAICGEILGEIRPAATLLVVAGLYKPEMKVEIEVTARRRAA
jgi:enamine deaminase RidA (YjgF/YER057c/UK114 family)